MGGGLGLNELALPEIAPGQRQSWDPGLLPPSRAARGPPHEDHQLNPQQSPMAPGGHAGKVGLHSTGHLSVLLQSNRP